MTPSLALDLTTSLRGDFICPCDPFVIATMWVFLVDKPCNMSADRRPWPLQTVRITSVQRAGTPSLISMCVDYVDVRIANALKDSAHCSDSPATCVHTSLCCYCR